jgi:predicted transcriptional regulator
MIRCPILVRLNPEDMEKLREMARELDTKKAILARTAIKEYLKKNS